MKYTADYIKEILGHADRINTPVSIKEICNYIKLQRNKSARKETVRAKLVEMVKNGEIQRVGYGLYASLAYKNEPIAFDFTQIEAPTISRAVQIEDELYSLLPRRTLGEQHTLKKALDKKTGEKHDPQEVNEAIERLIARGRFVRDGLYLHRDDCWSDDQKPAQRAVSTVKTVKVDEVDFS